MKITISNLELYMKCPRAYKLHNLEKIEPQCKSLSLCKAIAARQVILQLHALDCGQEDIAQLCETVWQEEISDPKVDAEELAEIVVQGKPQTKTRPAVDPVTRGEKYLGEIKTWCGNYWKFESAAKVLHSDIYFEDTIGDITLCGHIDQIREHPQAGIQVLRFSTSCHAPAPDYLQRDFRASLYAHALWHGKLYPAHPDTSEEIEMSVIPEVYTYHLPYLEQYQRKNGSYKKGDYKGNPMIHSQRGEKDLLDFEYETLYVTSGIEIGYFPMNVVRACGCSLCNFAYRCKDNPSTEVVAYKNHGDTEVTED